MLLLIYLITREVLSKKGFLFVLLAASFYWATIALAQDYRGISGRRAPLTLSGYAPATFLMPRRSKTV